MDLFGALLVWGNVISNTLLPALWREAEVNCAAYAIYHEGRGEPRLGQEAIFYVIKGRVQDNLPRFGGNNYCGVITHKTIRPTDGKEVSEFSGVVTPFRKPGDTVAWDLAYDIAYRGIHGHLTVPAELEDARFFINDGAAGPGGRCFFRGLVKIDLDPRLQEAIGKHEFYRFAKTRGEAMKVAYAQEFCLRNLPARKIIVAKHEKKKNVHVAAKKGKHKVASLKNKKGKKVAMKKGKKGGKKYAQNSPKKKKTRKT